MVCIVEYIIFLCMGFIIVSFIEDLPFFIFVILFTVNMYST